MSSFDSNYRDSYDDENLPEKIEKSANLELRFDLVPPDKAEDFSELFTFFRSTISESLRELRFSKKIWDRGSHSQALVYFNQNTGQLHITLRDKDYSSRMSSLNDLYQSLLPAIEKAFCNINDFPVQTPFPQKHIRYYPTPSGVSAYINKLLTNLNIIDKKTPEVTYESETKDAYLRCSRTLREYFTELYNFFASEKGLKILENSQIDLDEEKEKKEDDKHRLCEKITIDFSQIDFMGVSVRLNGSDFYICDAEITWRENNLGRLSPSI